MLVRHALAALLLLALAAPARAEDPLITDRPDVAESAVTVGSGRLQLETGVLFERFRGGDPDAVTMPTLLRVGTGPDTELRLETAGPVFISGGGGGFSDLSLGGKWTFHEGDPTLGLLMTVTLPTGARSLRVPAAEPAMKLLLDADLGGGWVLGFNVGAALPEDPVAGTRFVQAGAAMAVGHEISEGVTAYGELFGGGPDVIGSTGFMAADAGFLFLLNPDLQLDVEVFRGLSAQGLDWGVGAGVSARF